MSSKHQTPRQVYDALQKAVRCDTDEGSLELSVAGYHIFRKRNVTAGGPIPSRENVRAMLKGALNILEIDRVKRPEISFLRLGLRRHLELGISLEQAFGYAKVGKGAPAFIDANRGRCIAVAVFEQRLIKGKNADVAGYEAGKKFGIKKTQALAAFTTHGGHALREWKLKRLEKKFPQLMERLSKREKLSPEEMRILEAAVLWSASEEQRIRQHYGRKKKNKCNLRTG